MFVVVDVAGDPVEAWWGAAEARASARRQGLRWELRRMLMDGTDPLAALFKKKPCAGCG